MKANHSCCQGELEHRRVKRFYARTSKHRFARQIAKQHRRHQILQKIARRKPKVAALFGQPPSEETIPPTPAVPSTSSSLPQNQQQRNNSPISGQPIGPLRTSLQATTPAVLLPSLSFTDEDPLPFTSPDNHHHMSLSNEFPLNLNTFVNQHHHDPAMQVCDHDITRVKQLTFVFRTSFLVSRTISWLDFLGKPTVEMRPASQMPSAVV